MSITQNVEGEIQWSLTREKGKMDTSPLSHIMVERPKTILLHEVFIVTISLF